MMLPETCCEGVQAGIRPALARRARAIERDLPGPHATEQEWRILLGQEAGALSWATTMRLMQCLDAAGERAGSLLACDAVGAE